MMDQVTNDSSVTNDSNDTNLTCLLNDQQKAVITWTILSLGIVSLICCIFIIFVMVLFCKYRTTTQRLILYLTITIAVVSISNILHGTRKGSLEDNHIYCILTGFLDQVSGWMEVMAICCLTFDLVVKVVFLKFNTYKYEWVYIGLIFIFPFSFNWIPFICSAYGGKEAICWIRKYKIKNCEKDYYSIALQFALYWVPIYIILTFVFIAYTVARIKAHRRVREYSGRYDPGVQTTRELLVREIRLYQFYPIVLALILFIAFIARVVETIVSDDEFFGLRLVRTIFITIQGPVIAMVFLFDYDTRHQLCHYNSIKAAFFDWCCYCKQRKVKEYVVITDENRTDSFSRSVLNKIVETSMEKND